jgi:carbon monoxide dehydrogenase subunit G
MAPDRFTHSATVNASAEHAWEVLQDPQTWGTIAGVERVYDARHTPDGVLRSYRFTVKAAGKSYEGIATTHDADRPSLMAVTIDTPEVMGTITVELTPSNPGGTDMTASLKMKPRGVLSVLVFPVIAMAVGSGFPRQIEEIAARMDA